MDALNPIKLAIRLNTSIFYYEVMEEHTKGFEIAEKALNKAMEKSKDNDRDINNEANDSI